MKKNFLLCAAMFAALSTTAHAQTQTGRQLDVIAAPTGTATVEEFGPGVVFLERPVVGIFWDERCAQVNYTFNSNAAANPGTEGEISPEDLAAIVQTGLDRWNDNPSSYIEMNVTSVRDLGDRPRVGGDFINEATFITAPGFGALASSPSTSLIADATFIAGDDLDGDGDSDVFDPAEMGMNNCADVDEDGDIEFPAGDYAAGTILDNDVQFSSTVGWETVATSSGLADVDAVSTHEFGHSHGLSHATINQISEDDGTTSTMFPFISTTNAAAELGSRTPHVDDLAASAYIYQEGNGDMSVSDLQAGDVAFSDAYSLVSGTISSTTGPGPVSGAAVSMRDRRSGDLQTMAYSGKTNVFEFPGVGLFVFDESIVDGDYVVPVPSGSLYTAELEALDGNPVAAGNISTNAVVSEIAGVTNFPEESYTRRDESVEFRPTQATPFYAGRFGKSGIDIVTNEETAQRNAGDINFGGTGAIFGANDIIYAEQFDRADVLARIANGDVPISGLAETFLIGEAASVAVFDEGRLAIGKVDEEGIVNISSVLSRARNVVGQDGDSTIFAFSNAKSLPFRIKSAFNRDADAQLFFLVESNDVELGPNAGFPLAFVGLDTDVAGTSFLSTDNGPLLPFGSTFAMELRYVNDGGRVSPFLTRP